MDANEAAPAPAKKLGCLKLAGIIAGVLVGLTVIGAIIGDGKKTEVGPAGNASVVEEAVKTSLSGPQGNAVRSAQSYLSMSGFSRKGLIHQLSSGAGDGYDVADATAAVDSLNVDWNEQAVRSAKQYLEISGFSCKGLIQQLSSGAGEQYSRAEAEYGAKQAGAC